ncbi:Uncharacterised protein [Yersinia aldovae]|nr:Uncharacterised protein [Yersinia aldovae]
MTLYYVNTNKQNNGDNEVHSSTCGCMPIEKNRKLLGDYNSCQEAVKVAIDMGYNANGCYYCSKACHTS